MNKIIVFCSALLLLAPAFVLAQTEEDKPGTEPTAREQKPRLSLDEALAKAATYKFGDSRESLTALAYYVRMAGNAPAERDALAGKLAGLLGAGATDESKRFACRQLSLIGSAATVPALAPLLGNEKVSDMARYALERLALPASDAALHDALGTVTGKPLIGVINSVGERRDRQAVPALIKLTANTDTAIVGAAAKALGKIGGPEVAATLSSLSAKATSETRATLADALLRAAGDLTAAGQGTQSGAIYQSLYAPAMPRAIRIAALHGLVAAQPDKAMERISQALGGDDRTMQLAALEFVPDLPASDTPALAALLPQLSPANQALMIQALAARPGAAVGPAILTAAKSTDATVRLAALRALATVGDVSALPLLAQVAGGMGAERDAARQSLTRLGGEGVRVALAKMLFDTDAKVRVEVARALAARGDVTAVGVLLQAAGDTDARVRVAALSALGDLAKPDDVPALLALFQKATAPDELSAGEKALITAFNRMANKDAALPLILTALKAATPPMRSALLRVVASTGTGTALNTVRGTLEDRDAGVQDAAVRALANWPDTGAAPDLLALAGKAATPAQKILALRGYVRLAGLGNVPAAQKLTMYQAALPLAQSAEDKRGVLAGLGTLNTLDALRLATPLLDDTEVKEEAAAAVVAIAKGMKTAKADVKAADIQAALKKALQVSTNDQVRKDATGLMK